MSGVKLAKAVSPIFLDLAKRLEDRSVTCRHAVDADLHQSSASAIRTLLAALSQGGRE